MRVVTVVPLIFILGGSTITAPTHPNPTMDRAPSFGEDCTTCGNCTYVGLHQIRGDGPDRRRLEEDHGCDDSNWNTGTCPERHQESAYCDDGPQMEEALLDSSTKERLWLAVRGASGGNIQAITKEFGPRVEYNPGRSAVQVIGCGDLVVLSIPLTASQLAQPAERD